MSSQHKLMKQIKEQAKTLMTPELLEAIAANNAKLKLASKLWTDKDEFHFRARKYRAIEGVQRIINNCSNSA